MTLTVENGGVRLDAFIALKTELSRSHVKKITDEGGVLVNGKPQKGKYTVKEGDVIEFSLPELKPLDVKPVDIPLDIVYQDADVALINKPQGMTVHAGNGTDDNTLVNALLFALDSLSGINGVIRPGIVHRIDKDTSGLLIVAKNDRAHISLASQIESKTCKRIYLALLHGKVKEDSGVIDTFIDRSAKDRTAYAVSTKGRRAVTDYRVIKRYEGYTLCEFSLRTGRTHQIRVHSKHLGNPVVGDKVYGPKKCPFNLEGQLLHAYSLTFTHPTTNEQMTFSCDLPEYFKKTLAKLKEI
ncbi:MAG: RluA family pseudouridine synthase [Clostridiales bacterium]|nr:RluA family pseudouridine synthase [Clostridiales bacterium]